MAVTILDIGKRLGLSHTTVSRVLNNREDINIPESTRQRVLQMAKEMGYRPNRAARSLVTGKTRNIAVFAEGMAERTGPHFARMLEAIERRAIDMKYRVLVCSDLDSILDKSMVDGIILLAEPDQFLSRLVDAAMPGMFVYSRSNINVNCVTWSDFDGSKKAGEYLIGLEHQRIAAVFANYRPELEREYAKVQGFRQALKDVGLSATECWGELSSDPFWNAYLLTKDLIARDPGFTGVFCRNDFLALGTIKALRESKLDVPGDVSVVGYNDTGYAACSDPLLTSVHTPIAEAGELALQALVKTIESGDSAFAGTPLPVSLTIRESCAPAKDALSRKS